MVWEILLGVGLAGLLLCMTGWLWHRELRHISAKSWLVVCLTPEEPQLEQQLRAFAFLRQQGELRSRIVLLTDGSAPEQAQFVQKLRREALVDEAESLAAFTRRIEGELRQAE